jgi:hypothetical protein
VQRDKQKLDLFEVASAPASELGAGAPEVVGAEALDADLLGRLLHRRPDRPVSLKPLLIRPPLRMERSSRPFSRPAAVATRFIPRGSATPVVDSNPNASREFAGARVPPLANDGLNGAGLWRC